MNIKTITVVIDGNQTKLITFKNSLDKALAEKNIVVGPKDKIEPSIDSKVVNKSTVTIKRAVNITVQVANEEKDILSAEEDIDSMLKAEGISLNEIDKLSLPKETKLTEGMKLGIVKVEVKELTETEAIDFSTVVKTNSSLANTQKKIVQEGKEGEKKTTFKVTYENGKEVLRDVVNQIVSKQPKEKIIVQGTYPLMPVSRGGDPMPYSKVIKARATAYSPTGGRTTAYTATGRKAVRNPEGYSTIAVDPSVIPYGTKLFVQGYGFAIAADTGSAIIGNTIDVFFDTKREALNWAVKHVNVYVLK
ncbi:3D domain-containing protein [Clostridium swellfunianum]|uniref:3D domain-containing protein n=1 Tax=Clostridium swellfunianum TaxID=1367462 RepID=UPI002030D381|nr:3D domain-containing protein [Clostridium swellfunianum]MCM0647918.1 3D domain-containing protein [Clostridium swellfunianum]